MTLNIWDGRERQTISGTENEQESEDECGHRDADNRNGNSAGGGP